MTSLDEFHRRQTNVFRVMAKFGIDCLLLNQTDNIKYLTGASNRCSWVFIKQDGRMLALVLESDYAEYRKQSILEDIRVFRAHDPLKQFHDLISELDLQEDGLALENEHLRHFEFVMMADSFGPKIHHAFGADYVVQEARMIKTSAEIAAIARAAQLAVYGMGVARASATPGMTEMQLADIVRTEMLRHEPGCSALLYVGTDGRSSLAHTPPTTNTIEQGPVTIDIHTAFGGVHADMARTLFLKASRPDQVEMYTYLSDRIGSAIAAVSHGRKLVEIRKRFYKSIDLQPDWILLSGPLLHGVGAMNSELPRFDYPYHSRGYPDAVEANMTLAMSNIGLSSRQGWGVRYEDTFLVTKDKPALLTKE